jgi:hypothetical protein
MPRIERDPTQDTCPDYQLEEYEEMRNLWTAGVEEGDREAAEERAVRRLEEIWQTAHRRQVEAWEAQQEEEERRRNEEEEERRRREEEREGEERERRRREEEERRKQGSTKKVLAWDNDNGIASSLVNRPAQYALNKLAAVAYVEVDYVLHSKRV